MSTSDNSIEERKRTHELHKRAYECELKKTYNTEIQNDMTCIQYNEVNNIAKWN